MQEFFMDYGLWLLIGLLLLIGVIFLLSGRKGKAGSAAPFAAPVEERESAASSAEMPAIVTAPVPEAVAFEPSPAPAVVEPVPQPEPVPAAVVQGEGDDLLRLKGVGPKLSALLIELGVTRYAQIAAWTDADVAAIDAKLGNFKGRPVRDQWVDQAKYLAAGDVAGFEAKYGKI